MGLVRGVQIDRRVKGAAPFDHGRIIVGVRNCDGGNPAQRFHSSHRRLIDQADTIPQQVALWRLHQQCTLGNGKAWLGADADQARRFGFDLVVMGLA